jgi:hypothetical protein
MPRHHRRTRSPPAVSSIEVIPLMGAQKLIQATPADATVAAGVQ